MAYVQTPNPAIGQGQHRLAAIRIVARAFFNPLTGGRKRLDRLEHLPERELRDAGLTRSDIQSMTAMPNSADVVTELSIRASTGRRHGE